MSNFVLEVKNLQVTFENDNKKTSAVDNVSFSLERGEILGIVGESGSGKSVTSLAIMGLLPETAQVDSHSEILFRETQIQDKIDLANIFYKNNKQKTARNYRGGPIAMIFQEPMSSFNPVYTIGAQLIEAILQHYERAFSLKNGENKQISLKLKRKYARGRAIQLLEQVQLPNPAEKMNRYPHELSGGQLQRVMIAMAIACNPTILIADEPTTALDVTVQAEILDLLRGLCRQRQMSMIFITHDLGVVAEIADRVLVMRRGKVVEANKIKEILENPQKAYTKGLLACRPRLGNTATRLPTVYEYLRDYLSDIVEQIRLGSKSASVQLLEEEVNNLSEEEKYKLSREESQLWSQVNQLLDNQFSPPIDIPKSQPPTINQKERIAENILTVKDLSIRFPEKGIFGQKEGDFVAVNKVSFAVERGKTLGIVGESGCGKSTLARAILRLLPTAAGKVIFQGQDITHLQGEPLRRLRCKMQIVFQNPYSSLNPRMNIGDAVLEPLIIHNQLRNKIERQEKVKQLFNDVGLNPQWINRYPHQLSGGQRQRVCIARALAINPDLIICDESVSALDVSVQAQVLNLLKELQSEYGLTYLFISHDLSVVEFMSDEILVMNKIEQDKVKYDHNLTNQEESGQPEKILYKPEKDYTKKLIRSIPMDRLTIKISGIPHRNLEILEAAYSKLSHYLEQKTGIGIRYKPVETYAEAVQAFSQGNLDLVCFDGFTGVLARYLVSDAKLIVQDSFRDYSVLIASKKFIDSQKYVRENEPRSLLKMLDKCRFIFPDKLSTSGYLMMLDWLRSSSNNYESILANFREELDYFGNDDRTLKLIAQEIGYDAGIVREKIWQQYQENQEYFPENLQVFGQTSPYQNIHWLVYPYIQNRYGDDIISQLQEAFLGLNNDNPESQEIKQLLAVSGFVSPQEDIYLNISQKVQLSEPEIGEILNYNLSQSLNYQKISEIITGLIIEE